jgi:hypothetical protein
MAMTFALYGALREKMVYNELVNVLQTSNQTAGVWDLTTTDAPYIQVNRLLELPTVGAVDCNTSITASDISAAPVTFSFDTFQTTIPLCYDVKAGANANGEAEKGILMAGLASAFNSLESLIVDGGTNFNGLDDLVVAGQTFAIGVSGTADVADLSKAIRITKGAGQKVFVANGATYDKVEKVLKDASLVSYQELAGTTFNTIAYRGIPVVINDNMTDGDVYLATLGGEGVSVVFNEIPGAKVGGVFDLIKIPMALGSINEYYRVIFRATQILMNPQSLTKVTGFTI